jgi:hypothetical protein
VIFLVLDSNEWRILLRESSFLPSFVFNLTVEELYWFGSVWLVFGDEYEILYKNAEDSFFLGLGKVY